LRTDCIKQFEPDGNADISKVTEELACDAEALVDLVGAVNVGVVYEAFPADGRAGLLAANRS
jgi:hypothetical protein